MDSTERSLEDYSKGRFAWLLSRPRLFRQPSNHKGGKGVWGWTTPTNFRALEPEIAAQLEGERS